MKYDFYQVNIRIPLKIPWSIFFINASKYSFILSLSEVIFGSSFCIFVRFLSLVETMTGLTDTIFFKIFFNGCRYSGSAYYADPRFRWNGVRVMDQGMFGGP